MTSQCHAPFEAWVATIQTPVLVANDGSETELRSFDNLSDDADVVFREKPQAEETRNATKDESACVKAIQLALDKVKEKQLRSALVYADAAIAGALRLRELGENGASKEIAKGAVLVRARVLLTNKMYEAAADELRHVLGDAAATPSDMAASYRPSLCLPPGLLSSSLLLTRACADALFGMFRYAESSRMFQRALTMRARDGAGDEDIPGDIIQPYDLHGAPATGATDANSLQVGLARALYFGKVDVPTAGDLVMAVLNATNENHFHALFAYGEITLDRGMVADCAKVVLRLLTMAPDHDGAKQMIASLCETAGDEGIQAIIDSVSAFWNADVGSAQGISGAAALSFLGISAREHGAIEASVAMIARAAYLSPASPTHALAACHAWELLDRLHESLAVCVSCLEAVRSTWPDALDGDDPVSRSDGFGGSSLTNASAASCFAARAIVPWDAMFEARAAFKKDDSSNVSRFVRDAARFSNTDTSFLLEMRAYRDPEAFRPAGDDGSGVLERFDAMISSMSGANQPIQHSSDDLQMLALHMAAVKILFLLGYLECAELYSERVVKPFRRMFTNTELHMTIIRNEQAYWGCIDCLSSFDRSCADGAEDAALSARRGQSMSVKPLVVLADSHSLCPAYRTIGDRLLVSMLVTGLKHYHLRPGCAFYPRAHFDRLAARLPEGIDVIVGFGEIDCREGLLVAVEKARHASLKDAIEATVAHYVRTLVRLCRKKAWTVYVHPIPPVLKETRAVVLAYNKELARQISMAPSCAPGKLSWLDGCVDSWLSGGELRPDLNLDGTHMHPRCLREVDASLLRL
ncbi:Tpr-like protein [Pycnococcus provasolii]